MPLVSVCIITYNSANTIIQTLNSIKDQTYRNIELIISDDFSIDESVSLCKEWLEKNYDSFVNTRIVTVDNNTGTSANANRAWRAAKGEWIKLLAGDDLLLPDCIESNVSYCKQNKEAKVLLSEVIPFREINGKLITEASSQYAMMPFWNKTAMAQFEELLHHNFLPAPTTFISRSILEENPYNEEIPIMEDYPQWINLTKKGIRLSFMNKPTVMYRMGDSVTRSKAKIFSPLYRDSYCKFFWDVLNPEIKKAGLVDAYNYQRKILFMYDINSFIFNNRKNKVVTLMARVIAGLLKRYKKIDFNY